MCDEARQYQYVLESFNHLGKPVMLFVLDEKNWSLLGTLGVSGVVDGKFRSVEYRNIVELSCDEAFREKKTEKSKITELDVKTENQEVKFVTSPGGEFFGFWNICLMLQRMLSK